jgi:hypothetical protein
MEDFRSDLITLLVSGMNLSFMEFKKLEDIIFFIDDLKEHYMKDEKLSHLFFWCEGNIILHDVSGLPSTFGVVIDGDFLQFRTENGSIDNHKNAGKILMSTISFISHKLTEKGKILTPTPNHNNLTPSEVETPKEDEDESDDETSGSSDFDWL